ncbi:hypothetical protein SELMODRAFT_405005 [Selaginella moellendorffii]|uniref:Glycerol-3-phosphate acyltransferase RAM2/GPAT1-8 HAD-like domain-containing protein n=1 Tax=Selaginella moellendorffii TaxID=88036 RepID=D8QY32_SELML|nr:hypothetical protein SELMODRAFT_405005 [Selaginella moellendorffii]
MVVTSLPALMVEPLASHYLGASAIGSKLDITSKGYCTGLIKMVVCSENKAQLAQKHFGGDRAPISIGIGSGSGTDFLGVCKKCLDARSNPSPPCATVPKKDYIKPTLCRSSVSAEAAEVCGDELAADGGTSGKPLPIELEWIQAGYHQGLITGSIKVVNRAGGDRGAPIRFGIGSAFANYGHTFCKAR